MKFKREDFIKKAQLVWGDKFDYSMVEYRYTHTHIKILCKKHNKLFTQSPSNHYRHNGCPECKKEISHCGRTICDFELDKKRFDYKLIPINKKINTNKDKLPIRCIKHDFVFHQTLYSHTISKYCCPMCEKEELRRHRQKSTNIFIKEAKEVFGNLYDYSKTKYNTAHSKVEVICKKHGSFWVRPKSHLFSHVGCPICQTSKGESKIESYLKEKSIEFIYNKTFTGCKYKNKLRFDFYLPTYNLVIEYDGIQHYTHISRKKEGIDPEIEIRDNIKNKFCADNQISLLRIPYWDMENIDTILDNHLQQ